MEYPPRRPTHILDLAKEAEPRADGILSGTVFLNDRLKAVVFRFGQDLELSEHRAANPVMFYFVKVDSWVGHGNDVQAARAGTWVNLPAGMKHSVKAKTPVDMLQVLLK